MSDTNAATSASLAPVRCIRFLTVRSRACSCANSASFCSCRQQADVYLVHALSAGRKVQGRDELALAHADSLM
jgi:hypothetical protein